MNVRERLEVAGVDADLTGEYVLVTGSTSGIGRRAAEMFAELGATVLVHGRDIDAGASVVDDIESRGGEAVFMKCDFSNLDRIKPFAESIRRYVDGDLSILVNNAGGYFTHTQDDGLNYTFVVNHLAPFLLTQHLMPAVENGDRSVIVNTASSAHEFASFDADKATISENSWGTYCHSKLLNLLFTKRLSRIRHNVRVVAVHPGAIPGSGFARNLPSFVKTVGMKLASVPFVPLKTPEQGSIPLVYGALHPAVVSGMYVTETRDVEPTSEVLDTEVQDAVWELSVEVGKQYLPEEYID